MSNKAVINVKYADPAPPGRKQATIKTQEGEVYGIWPDKLGLLQPGRTYEIEFTERDYQGRKYRTISKCTPVETPAKAETPKDESAFVAHMLAAALTAGAVPPDVGKIGRAIETFRALHRVIGN